MHFVKSREIVGSIPDRGHCDFYALIPPDRIVALGSTQPLTEMSTRNLPWRVKGGRCVGLTTLPPYHRFSRNAGSLNLLGT
jgi:hypothetical protein